MLAIVDKHGCNQWFENTLVENLHVLSKYPRGIADQYLHLMDHNRTTPKQMVTSFPVIVTAANSAFYGVTQGLLKSIYDKLLPKYKDKIKVIYYDMGLNSNQHDEV